MFPLSIFFSNSAQGSVIIDSGSPTFLKGIQGGSVWFHVTEWPRKDLGVKLGETIWSFSFESIYRWILTFYSEKDITG